MGQALGYVNATTRGYEGHIATLTAKAKIEIMENPDKEGKQPDYRIYTTSGCEIGGGWLAISKSTGEEYVSLTLANPQLGQDKIYANLAPVKDKPGRFVMLWNTQN